jgi:G protein-coupled receptor GPR1
MLGLVQRWATLDIFSRGLSQGQGNGNAMSGDQNRAILVCGLTCACVSLVIVLVAVRWFLLMKRLFRHRLILFLVASDTFKAIWYFVFAVVAISNGPVRSTSSFCQASGYLLLLSVEASDFAILLIAIHTMLCVFKPSSKSGEGGLYKYRHWLYPIWLGPPFLMASLAFINGSNAYVTSGTFCYLPKRPFWYRLALGWIPRYMIIITILLMYTSIYVYVHIKFRGFKNLHAPDSSMDSMTASRRTMEVRPVIPEVSKPPAADAPAPEPAAPPATPKPRGGRPSALRMHSYNSMLRVNATKREESENRAPWDSMSFITQLPLESRAANTATAQEDSPSEFPELPDSSLTRSREDRKQSEAPTMHTNFTGETVTTQTTFAQTSKDDNGSTDHLRNTRVAIRRQLRFLFIYPIIYLLMWAFPFANHAILYNDYYVQHPPFWLSVVSTASLALQAGVNGVIFSLREKPWRRIDPTSRFSVNLGRLGQQEEVKAREADAEAAKATPSPHWWEAEGRKRRDSVWMGTDMLTRATSRRHRRTDTLLSISERPQT